MRTIEIPQHLLQGDYEGDQAFRDTMHKWVQKLWQEKDKQMLKMLKKAKSK
jgi:hypothetical protein